MIFFLVFVCYGHQFSSSESTRTWCCPKEYALQSRFALLFSFIDALISLCISFHSTILCSLISLLLGYTIDLENSANSTIRKRLNALSLWNQDLVHKEKEFSLLVLCPISTRTNPALSKNIWSECVIALFSLCIVLCISLPFIRTNPSTIQYRSVLSWLAHKKQCHDQNDDM